MKRLLKIINHRDFVLSLAVVVGLILGESTRFLASISMYTLMLAMAASTIGFSFKSWNRPSKVLRPLVSSFLLNYLLYGVITLILAWLLLYNTGQQALWVGFVIIVASPPGPAVIPFSAMLKGDENFSTTGLLGAYLLAMIVTPTIMLLFLGSALVSPLQIFRIMLLVVIVPLIISRLARHPKVLPHAQRASGTAIKWLFFLIITPIVGMNRSVFWSDPVVLLYPVIIFFSTMFLLGYAYNRVMVRVVPTRALIISSTFMLTIKSAAFAAVVSFGFFEDEPLVALPAAVLSVYIVLFAILYALFVNHWLDRRLDQRLDGKDIDRIVP